MASKTRIFFLNALSLTATALIMRGVGMIFNVIVSNRAGSEAMGLYSMLGSVYAFTITLGAAGVNLGATRLISEALGLGLSSSEEFSRFTEFCFEGPLLPGKSPST